MPIESVPANGLAPAEPLLFSAEQVAELLQVSERSLWRLLSAGKLIQSVKIGGSTRWRSHEIRQWIEDGCPPPSAYRS